MRLDGDAWYKFLRTTDVISSEPTNFLLVEVTIDTKTISCVTEWTGGRFFKVIQGMGEEVLWGLGAVK